MTTGNFFEYNSQIGKFVFQAQKFINKCIKTQGF